MFLIFLTFFFFASAMSANKILLSALSPALLTGLRMLIAGSILFIYLSITKKQRLTVAQVTDNIPGLISIAVLTTYIPSLLKAYSLSKMPSGKWALYGSLEPFITALFSYFLLSERLTLRKIIGMGLGFFGMIGIHMSTYRGSFESFAFFSYPELAALTAMFVSRYGWLKIASLLKRNIYEPTQINSITMLISGVLALLTVYIQDIYYYITGYMLHEEPYSSFSIGTLGMNLPIFSYIPFSSMSATAALLFFLSYTIIVGNLLAYNLYAKLLKQYSVTFVSLSGFSIPIFVSLLGWLFLGEQLNPSFIVACVVTFIGLYIFFQEEA